MLTLLVFFNMSGKKNKTNFKASSLQILSLLYRPFIVLHTRWSDGEIQLLYVRVSPRGWTVTGNRATVHDLVNYHEELEFEYLRLTPLCDWSGSLFRDLTCSNTSEPSVSCQTSRKYNKGLKKKIFKAIKHPCDSQDFVLLSVNRMIAFHNRERDSLMATFLQK